MKKILILLVILFQLPTPVYALIKIKTNPSLTKKWDFVTTVEGWQMVKTTGSDPIYGAASGDGDGALLARCTALGGGCSSTGVPGTPGDIFTGQGFFYQGTWESIGVPAGSIISKILAVSGGQTSHSRAAKRSNTLPGSNYIDGYWLFGNDTFNFYLANTVSGELTTSFVDYNVAGDSDELAIPSSDTFTLANGYYVSINVGSTGTQQTILDEAQLVIQYKLPRTMEIKSGVFKIKS